MNNNIENILQFVSKYKIDDLLKYDLRESHLGTYCIIASVSSIKYAGAIAKYLQQYLKSQQIICYIDGFNSNKWLIVDAGDVVLHLLTQEGRELYNLESIWDAKNE